METTRKFITDKKRGFFWGGGGYVVFPQTIVLYHYMFYCHANLQRTCYIYFISELAFNQFSQEHVFVTVSILQCNELLCYSDK